MDKIQELIDLLKERKNEERGNLLLWIIGVVGAICALAGIAYAVYRYLTPDYLEDFSDEDFEDDFDSYFEDEDIKIAAPKQKVEEAVSETVEEIEEKAEEIKEAAEEKAEEIKEVAEE